MQRKCKKPSNYELVGKLIGELKLRKYSYRTGEKYRDIVIRFLRSGKTPREFLLSHSNKSRSTMRSIYFALKFFYENVLNEKFEEKLPLAKSKQKLPVVLGRGEIQKLFEVTTNPKHKLVLALCYYAGLRLSKAMNLRWEDIDLERSVIHLKQTKGEKERVVFLHNKLKELLLNMELKSLDGF